MVIDYHTIAASLGSQVPYDHSDTIHRAANDQRNALLKQMQSGETGCERVWVSSSSSTAAETIPHHELQIVDPGLDEALDEATRRGERWVKLTDDWYLERDSQWVW